MSQEKHRISEIEIEPETVGPIPNSTVECEEVDIEVDTR